ncbi:MULTISPECIES: DUF1707 SHOCT-like domain-containing protein [unclassified Luteococcus]|uniref:DUF1707 SHOCT-like domain-containing protein n=1 Tax=unclassified Luteococcus TaxID=2639923 RepID=UPI00313D0A02
MSNLPISSKYRSQPARPVDEAEREDLTKRLNDAFTSGSIDGDTYRTLLDQLYGAQTLGELVPVVEHLPAKQTYDDPAMVRQQTTTAPGELAPAGMNAQLAFKVGGVITALSVLLVLIVAVLL